MTDKRGRFPHETSLREKCVELRIRDVMCICHRFFLVHLTGRRHRFQDSQRLEIVSKLFKCESERKYIGWKIIDIKTKEITAEVYID